MPSELPTHGSPPYQPVQSPRPKHLPHNILQLDPDSHENAIETTEGTSPPPSLLSPAFTPPSTPGSMTPARNNKRTKSFAVDSSTETGPGPKLLEVLPEVECVVRARIPTTDGQEMFLHLYSNNIDKKEHLAIVFGPHIRSRSLDRERPGETEMDRMIRGAYTGRLFPGRMSSRADQRASIEQSIDSPSLANSQSMTSIFEYNNTNGASDLPTPPLVRIHSECYTGETVWSARCDCGEQLDEAARLMSAPSVPPTPRNFSVPPSPASSMPDVSDPNLNPGGVIIYLRQEGRGIGLSEKLKAYNLQDLGSDTVEANLLLRHPADARSYGLATAMLVDLGLGGERGIRLLTNNPDKVRAVEGPEREVRVRERVAMVPLAWKTGGKQGIRSAEVESYLKTKIEQFGHMIERDQQI